MKISGVAVNAHSVLKAERDLEPLTASLPSEEKQLRSFRLTVPTRSVHWGMTWGNVEDSMLLVGILLYGMGNWEAIKNDHTLKLTNKVRASYVDSLCVGKFTFIDVQYVTCKSS